MLPRITRKQHHRTERHLERQIGPDAMTRIAVEGHREVRGENLVNAGVLILYLNQIREPGATQRFLQAMIDQAI